MIKVGGKRDQSSWGKKTSSLRGKSKSGSFYTPRKSLFTHGKKKEIYFYPKG